MVLNPEKLTLREDAPPQKRERSSEQAQNLEQKIRSISHLPSQRERARYLSFFEKSETPQVAPAHSHESPLSESSVQEIIDVLSPPEKRIPPIASNEDAQTALAGFFKEGVFTHAVHSEALWRWAQKNPDAHIPAIEDMVAVHLNEGKPLTLSMLALLGRLDKDRNGLFIEDSFARALELSNQATILTLFDQLAVLNRLPDQRAHTVLHSIFDFMRSHIRTVQDHIEDELDAQGYHASFLLRFWEFLNDEQKSTTNYLIAQHAADVCEMQNMFDTSKEGSLAGVPGGAEDETIYAHAHVEESYQNRKALGMYEVSPIARPVLPVMPGYIGEYRNGRIAKAYRTADIPANRTPDEVWVKKSDPNNRYEDMYAELNEPSSSRHPSRGLDKLRGIWKFLEKNTPFFFDLSRIDGGALHPMVRTKLVMCNEEFVKSRVRANQRPVHSMNRKEFETLLFPDPTQKSIDQRELYLQLSSLSMRKKIEEDFGIHLSDQSLWVQRNFLAFLEERTIEEVERLQKFIKTYGDDGLKAFISTEHDTQFGTALMSIGDTWGEAAQPLFAKFAEIVDAAYRASDYIGNNFPLPKEIHKEFDHDVIENLLARGKELLQTSAKNADNPEKILESLQHLRGDIMLFTSYFQELKTTEKNIAFSEIKDVSFFSASGEQLSEEEKNEMKRIYALNFPSLEKDPEHGYTEEFRTKIFNGLEAAFSNPQSTFYLLKHANGDIIAFNRFLDESTPQEKMMYVGSFNVNPAYQGSKLGETFTEHTVDDYAKRGYTIRSQCDPRTSISRFYIEHGRWATGVSVVEGVVLLDLERDSFSYKSKKMSEQEIIRSAEENLATQGEMIVASFNETPDFSLLEKGYVLTRWLKKKQKHYCVFELRY